jgi:tRNA C32,U32 (ribose-2'-O)-methylase TrmJ
LAQAVLIVAYELWQAHAQLAPANVRPPAHPADAAQLEGLFDAAERALWGIEFFKSGSSAAIMRSLRSLIHRADLDAREAALLRAMALETLGFLRRKGVEPGSRPSEEES